MRPESRALERFSVRWIALGAAVILIALLAGEKLVWHLVSDDTSAFLQRALDVVSTPGVSPEEIERLRSETRERLLVPPVIALALVVLLSPAAVGFLLGRNTGSLWNAPIACAVGVVVALVVSGALSLSGAGLSFLFALLSLPGALAGRYLLRRSQRC